MSGDHSETNAPGADADFRILGPLEVDHRGVRVPIGGPKQQKVLAVLLLEAGHAVPIARLAAAIWDDTPPATASKQVRNAVSVLRRSLGVTDQIVAVADAYRLDVTDDQLDVRIFERLVGEARGHATAGRSREAVATFRAALALWRGAALAGLSGGLLEAARTRLHESRLSVVEECAVVAIALGEYDQVIADSHMCLAENPFRERLVGQLMRALHGAGRSDDAVTTFARFRERLAGELGLDPGAELCQLHDMIVRGEPPSAGDPPRPATVRHPVAVPPVPAQLPADVAAYTGRDDHLSTLDTLLSNGVGLAVITGTAGVGKTALAVHWAHRVRHRFRNGQLYVNLRGYDTAEPVTAAAALARFVRALGVPFDAIPSDVDELAALYRSLLADRRMLVVIDNARDVEQVRPLLPGAGSCVTLVTSREIMRCLTAVEGATTIALDVLRGTESRALLARLLGGARTRAEPRATGRLAELCDHLPLALRVAAANIAYTPARSLASYAADLAGAERLGHLTLDGDPRAAVAAAFDLSYTALSADAALVFRRLGLLPGPDFTADAAAAVSGVPLAVTGRTLARLAASNLVEHHVSGRYRLHDLLRLYARERCTDTDPEAARHDAHTRLLSWYLECLRAVDVVLHPTQLPAAATPSPVPAPTFRKADDAAAWLAREHTNLIAAVTEVGTHPYVWRLAERLRHHLHAAGDSAAALECGRAGLAAAIAAADGRGEAAMLLSIAQAQRALGSNDAAVETGRRALATARAAGEPHLESGALTSLSLASFTCGDLTQALRYEKRSLTIKRSLGPRTAQAASLGNIAMIHHALGEFRLAHEYFAAAWKLVDAASEVSWQASTLQGIAELYRDEGRCLEAVEHAARATALARNAGDRRTTVFALLTWGTALLADHRPADARPRLTEALELAQAIRVPRLEAETRLGMAAVERHAGHLERALEHATTAHDIAARSGIRVAAGEALTMLARIALDAGETTAAARQAHQALTLQERTGHRLGAARTRRVLGDAAHHRGHQEEAAAHWRAARDLFAAIGAPEAEELGLLLDS